MRGQVEQVTSIGALLSARMRGQQKRFRKRHSCTVAIRCTAECAKASLACFKFSVHSCSAPGIRRDSPHHCAKYQSALCLCGDGTGQLT